MASRTEPAVTLDQQQRTQYLKMFVSKLLSLGTAGEVVQYCENEAKPHLEKILSNARLSFSKHKSDIVVTINHRLRDGKAKKESAQPIKVLFRVTGELNGYLASPEFDNFKDEFNGLISNFRRLKAA